MPIQRPAAIQAQEDPVKLLRHAVFPVVVTGLVALTALGTATYTQVFLSFLLLQIAWSAWLFWQEKPPSQKDFPLFSFVAGMYWLAYGLPLFWGLPESWRFGGGFVSREGVARAQLLALVGIVSLYCGMHLGIGSRLRHMRTLELRDTTGSPQYVVLAMLLGVSFRYFPFLLGVSFRQVFMILGTTLPMVSYAILLRRGLMRRVPTYERALLVFFVLATVVFGLASGWLGAGAVVIMVSGCVLLDTRFRVPKIAVVAVFAYILFLQPSKEQFRATYWRGAHGSDSGELDRVSDWISISGQVWKRSWLDPDSDAIRRQIFSSISRFSLLQQSANVMDLTPSFVPYQRWRMYEYMAYTLIPRAIWRNKPTVNEANRLYQVTYGMTAERNLDGVSVAVGTLTESYISFGWLGTAVVMTLIGAVLDCISVLLLSCDAGWLAKGIGIALLPSLVSTEAQMAQYLGGLVQQILLTMVFFAPVAVLRRRSFSRLSPAAMQGFAHRIHAAIGRRGVRFVPSGTRPLLRERL